MEVSEASTSASSESSSDSEISEEVINILNELDHVKAIQNAIKSDMRKVVCGLTRSISNYYGENCEESLHYFNVMTQELTGEDFELLPYLLTLQNMLSVCDFLYEIRPNPDVRESFFFIQDKYMRIFFDNYPDFVCVDLLCEITPLNLNVYVFLSIDTNGNCEVIALGFLKTCEGAIKWLCDTFMKHNHKAEEDIKIILSNKILRDNEVFQNAFLGRPILTSFFHFMQYLKKELSCIGFNVNDEITKKVMTIIEKMSVVSDETEWSNLLEELKCSDKAFSNINVVWGEIKEQWNISKNYNLKLVWKSFNMALHSMRKSLKPNICSLETIEEVLRQCSTYIEGKRQDKFKKLGSTFYKPVVNQGQIACLKYSKILTPFAAKLVFEQIEKSNCLVYPAPYYEAEQDFHMTKTACSCNFCELLSLPCFHIFGFRKVRSCCLFDDSVCAKKWFKDNYKTVLIELFNVHFEQIVISSFRACENFLGVYTKVNSPLECYNSTKEQHASLLEYFKGFWDEELGITVLGPPSASTSTDTSRALEIYNARYNPAKDHFEGTYGISLNDFLSCENDTF